VKCDVGGAQVQTAVVQKNLTPVWNQDFEFVDVRKGINIVFNVMHQGSKKSPETCIGTATLSGDEFLGIAYENELKLTDVGDKSNKASSKAVLKVKIAWSDTQTPKTFTKDSDATAKVVTWVVRYRAIGLRAGPGHLEERVGGDLKPGQEFGVVEVVDGADMQQYLRLADGRGWAFTRSARDGTILAEKLDQDDDNTDNNTLTKYRVLASEITVLAKAETGAEATDTVLKSGEEFDVVQLIGTDDAGFLELASGQGFVPIAGADGNKQVETVASPDDISPPNSPMASPRGPADMKGQVPDPGAKDKLPDAGVKDKVPDAGVKDKVPDAGMKAKVPGMK
jgi:hypothetical protein